MKLGPYELDTIYTGDARELAKALPDKCAELAFADPPYWVGYKYNNGTDKDFEYIDPMWLASELIRLSTIAMLTPGIANIHDYPKPTWVMAWLKLNSQNRNFSGGANAWEPIFVYGNVRIDNDTINAPITTQHDASFHTCPKPIKMMLHLIERYTSQGGIVIDLTAGSGTTCKAAKMLGRHYLAFEIDPDTAERARQRVENTQPPLLIPQPEQADMFAEVEA